MRKPTWDEARFEIGKEDVAIDVALALAPSLLHGESAFAGDPAAFARGLRGHPWLAGWKSVLSGPRSCCIGSGAPRGQQGKIDSTPEPEPEHGRGSPKGG